MASLISVGQVLDHSFEHCRKHYRELLAITLWMVIASIPSIVGKLLAPSGEGAALTSGDWLSFVFSFTGVILVAVISLWMYATLIFAIAEQADGRNTNLKKTYRDGWRAFWRYLLLTLLVALMVAACVLIAVPGVAMLFVSVNDRTPAIVGNLSTPVFFIGTALTLFLLIKYSVQIAFAPYILLLENKSPVVAIQESFALVKGRWWSTAIRFLVPKIVYFLVFFIVSFVLFTALEMLLAFLMTNSAFGALVVYTASLFLSVFLSAIVTPFIIATDYYLYDSLRKNR